MMALGHVPTPRVLRWENGRFRHNSPFTPLRLNGAIWSAAANKAVAPGPNSSVVTSHIFMHSSRSPNDRDGEWRWGAGQTKGSIADVPNLTVRGFLPASAPSMVRKNEGIEGEEGDPINQRPTIVNVKPSVDFTLPPKVKNNQIVRHP